VEFKKGQLVRECGKKQNMVMKGLPGLATNSVVGSPKVRNGYVVCEWVDGRGRTRSRAFTLLSLELAE
jgi:hypothetical protein